MATKGWNWFLEMATPTLIYLRGVSKVYYTARSRYQDIAIVHTVDYGKVLILDGKTQSAEIDEFVYHEALVHPPMLAHGAPREVLVLGGGEGATLREVLKYPTVSRVVMVDIDEEVIEASKRYLPEWHQGAFEDERVDLVIGDAVEYMEETSDKFDVIIADLVDPIEGSPAHKAYTLEFYERARERLSSGGVFVTQATSPSQYLREYSIIYRTVREAFGHAQPYLAFINSFESQWGFVMGSTRPLDMSPEEVDSALKKYGIQTRFYDGVTHSHMFSLPKHIRARLREPGVISTAREPVTLPA